MLRVKVRTLVGVLAVTQTVGYGVLFYAFPVLLTPIAADLRTSTATVTGALTVAIIVAALAAIPVGRTLDRYGGRALMTAGSILAVVAVLGWSRVTSVWQLYAIFVAIGLASAMSLYEAAFSVVVAASTPVHRNNALLAITIVAGFASSIFFPLTGLLLEHYGWRHALVVLALLLAALAVPAHALAIPSLRNTRRAHSAHPALRDKTFWVLSFSFVIHAAAVSAVGVLLVSYLRHAGHPATVAATLSGLLGILSVTGRLLTTGLSKRYGMATVTAAVFLVQAGGAAMLPFLGASVAGAAVCVVAFGLGFGVATIARPAILAGRYGTSGFATIAGAMTLPVTLAKAGGPLAGAVVPPDAFITLAAAACLAAGITLWLTDPASTTTARRAVLALRSSSRPAP